ncbi:type VI secretion system baseplate subunit TssG [Candidatus Nesciobacter abundans]|uniref:Type VI secretion system baseplate subunit TssG n=1 Tax=Candidatus Nesciobacter abundans TaxID=2601668 RepID=A0A5C0UGE4_9PROT|nr:type VI secretion system baseplate subunit TssG [Candidatus Nesciobacter abundans]QEK39138.1 type VI secretion system baseplate subunit TssG [Candidatus Nesciobacter abundans]
MSSEDIKYLNVTKLKLLESKLESELEMEQNKLNSESKFYLDKLDSGIDSGMDSKNELKTYHYFDSQFVLYNLIKSPWNFSVHQAIFLLESYQKKNPKDIKEIVFKGSVEMSVNSSDIKSISYDKKRKRIEMIVNNVSMLGIQGALPLFYIHKFINDGKEKDHVFKDFLDIFNNKIIENTYKIAQRGNVSICNPQNKRDHVINKVLESIGSTKPYVNSYINNISRYVSAAFWKQKHNKFQLKRIILSFLNYKCDVAVFQFKGKWEYINDEDVFSFDKVTRRHVENKGYCLGYSDAPGRSFGTTFLGKRFLDNTYGIDILITIHSLDLYKKLMHGKRLRSQIIKLIKSYVPFDLNFSIKLNLKKESRPDALLGEDCILGELSWLNSKNGYCKVNLA